MSTCPTCFQEIEILPDSFGNRVQLARFDQGFSRTEMASELGYTRTSMVTRWENGTVVPKDIETVELIAAVLDVTPAWLLYGVQEPKLFEQTADALVVDEVEGEEVLVDEDFEIFSDDDDTESSGRTRPEILDKLADRS